MGRRRGKGCDEQKEVKRESQQGHKVREVQLEDVTKVVCGKHRSPDLVLTMTKVHTWVTSVREVIQGRTNNHVMFRDASTCITLRK